MDHLQEMLPEEAAGHPMAVMFITFMREAKRDIRRIPEEYVESLARVIGDAFTWITSGSIDETPDLDSEVEELLANV